MRAVEAKHIYMLDEVHVNLWRQGATSDEAGVDDGPSKERPSLTLTPAVITKLRQDVLGVDRALPEYVKDAVKRAPRTQKSKILTSADWFERKATGEGERMEAEEAAELKRQEKKEQKDARGELSKTQYAAQQREARKEAKRAAKEAAATAAAKQAKANKKAPQQQQEARQPAPRGGKKRCRSELGLGGQGRQPLCQKMDMKTQ